MIKYSSNTQQVIKQIKTKHLSLVTYDNALKAAAVTSLAESHNRIFVEGRDTRGGLTGGGNYSTNPLVIDLNEIGINTTSKKKAYKASTPTKRGADVRYFWGGYKSFRQSIGRRVDRIDLNLTNRLASNYKFFPIAPFKYGLGVDMPENSEKIKSIEGRFGRVFALTNKEISNVYKNIVRYLNDKAT